MIKNYIITIHEDKQLIDTFSTDDKVAADKHMQSLFDKYPLLLPQENKVFKGRRYLKWQQAQTLIVTASIVSTR